MNEVELIEGMLKELPTQTTGTAPTLPEVVPEGLTLIELNIAEALIEGGALSTIATVLDLPLSTVKTISKRSAVRKHVQDAMAEIGMVSKKNRESLIAQIIEARLANLQEGEDMSSLSSADTLALITQLDQSQREEEKAKLGNANNNIINVLNLIKKD